MQCGYGVTVCVLLPLFCMTFSCLNIGKVTLPEITQPIYRNFQVGQSQSLVPFGCLPSRNASNLPQMMHAWDLFLKYYETKVRNAFLLIVQSLIMTTMKIIDCGDYQKQVQLVFLHLGWLFSTWDDICLSHRESRDKQLVKGCSSVTSIIFKPLTHWLHDTSIYHYSTVSVIQWLNLVWDILWIFMWLLIWL